MFTLFSRSPRPRKALAPRTVSLSLERLEDRLTPTGPALFAQVQPPPPSEQVTLAVTYDANKEVTLSGQVTNTSAPGNQVIQLGGVVSTTATTNNQGFFSVTVPVQKLGTETATAANGLSNTAQVNLVGGTPQLTFSATPEGNGVWLFSGQVSGPPTQGEVVNFGGITALNGKSVAVNSDGSFSFYAKVSLGQGGTATATAVDWFGDTSQQETAFVSC